MPSLLIVVFLHYAWPLEASDQQELCFNLQLEATESRHQCGKACQVFSLIPSLFINPNKNSLSACFHDSPFLSCDSCNRISNSTCIQLCISNHLFHCLDQHRSCNTVCDNTCNARLFEAHCLPQYSQPPNQDEASG